MLQTYNQNGFNIQVKAVYFKTLLQKKSLAIYRYCTHSVLCFHSTVVWAVRLLYMVLVASVS